MSLGGRLQQPTSRAAALRLSPEATFRTTRIRIRVSASEHLRSSFCSRLRAGRSSFSFEFIVGPPCPWVHNDQPRVAGAASRFQFGIRRSHLGLSLPREDRARPAWLSRVLGHGREPHAQHARDPCARVASHALEWQHGPKPENDRAKRFMLALPVRTRGMVFELMGDLDPHPGPKDRWTLKALGGRRQGASAVGIEGFRRV